MVNYSERVREVWQRPGPETVAQDYRNLVRYATLAASSHNTQPWIFKLEKNQIRILPDLSRRCPAVDPDDHHLYASLGCAAENLLLAAEAAGLKGHCIYDASTSGVKINFEETAPFRSHLFEAIPERQCSRVEYDGSQLPAEQLHQLEEAGQGNGVSIMLFTDNDRKEQIARYVSDGNIAQFRDDAWARELKSWIRFSAREAVASGDGLFGPVMGSPDVPRWLGLLAMRFGFSAKKQNQKDYTNIRSSSAIAIVVSDIDDKPHWVEAGRCYERLALQATALGLRTAFINQPVEVAPIRAEFARFLGVGNRRPDLMVRIGRGPEAPRSLRRPVDEVLRTS
ncbi:Acg family FMN-binding oxidoreductase [Hydrocarboniclastica marina]|uniref:Tat pathway signal protein n=1 Tax=Hydrocarboniclastica marina TaxID=2259620 RepID=A0A4P7XHL4_9ALTE|nr:Tat pathway signal protein [Hydrocarboniclastica marina]QCF26153.1 Tat pathway signal protein [Hydrocarboniclastica marina]